MHEIIPNNR